MSRSLPPQGRSSPSSRRVVAALSSARSCGARAMDSMPRISVLLHQVNEPVRPVGAEDGIPVVDPLPVQGDDYHIVVELLGLVGATVPDAFCYGSRSALDRCLVHDVQVRHIVVVYAHGETILLRVGRHAFGYRPGKEYAVPFEPQVEVVASCVVLLYHEPGHQELLGW